MAGPVKAYNVTGTGAVGPDRSRIRQVVMYATGAGAFTITNGNGGVTLITQKFPTGQSVLNIPDNGIVAESGVYVSAISGTNAELTVFLS